MTPKTTVFNLPELSLEAVLQIQEFLHRAVEVFEDHYSKQLECFYRSMEEDSPELDLGDSTG